MKTAAMFGDAAASLSADARRAREIEDELRFHLESLTLEFEAQGLAPEQAETAARERFGDPREVQRQCLIMAHNGGAFMRTAIIVLLACCLVAALSATMMYRRAQQAREQAVMAQMLAQRAEVAARDRAREAEAFAGNASGSGKVITVDEALEAAARRVESELSGQPELAARLREAILKIKSEHPTPAAPESGKR